MNDIMLIKKQLTKALLKNEVFIILSFLLTFFTSFIYFLIHCFVNAHFAPIFLVLFVILTGFIFGIFYYQFYHQNLWQIGLLKSLGVKDSILSLIFTSFSICLTLIGELLAIGASYFIIETLLDSISQPEQIIPFTNAISLTTLFWGVIFPMFIFATITLLIYKITLTKETATLLFPQMDSPKHPRLLRFAMRISNHFSSQYQYSVRLFLRKPLALILTFIGLLTYSIICILSYSLYFSDSQTLGYNYLYDIHFSQLIGILAGSMMLFIALSLCFQNSKGDIALLHLLGYKPSEIRAMLINIYHPIICLFFLLILCPSTYITQFILRELSLYLGYHISFTLHFSFIVWLFILLNIIYLLGQFLFTLSIKKYVHSPQFYTYINEH